MVDLLFELSNLERVQRSGIYQFLFEEHESIASHSYKVTVIAYFLAKQMDLDCEKVLLMGLFHDSAETRTGDSNWIQKPYLTQDEEKARDDQLSTIDPKISSGLKKILDEYKIRESKESKIVKDADYISYFMTLKILELKGNNEAKKRLDYETKDLDFMRTDEGKALLREVLVTDPNNWTRVTHKDTMKVYKKSVTR